MATRKSILDQQDPNNPQNPNTNPQTGQILTGNQSGAGEAKGQPASVGSGWTNLDTYLKMNEGQTGGLVDTFKNENQKVIDKADGTAFQNSVTSDAQWSAKEKAAKAQADAVRKGDLSKINKDAFVGTAQAQYGANPDFTSLSGYNDVLKAFGDAQNRADTIQDYGTQKSTLGEAFRKDGKQYTESMGLLDTFLMRGNKDSGAAIEKFKKDNASFASKEGKTGVSSDKFKANVTDKLTTHFDAKRAGLATAQRDMMKSVGERRGGIEKTAAAALAARRAQSADPSFAENARTKYREEAARSGLTAEETAAAEANVDFNGLTSANSAFDEADVMSDSDWAGLAALEGLDKIKSGYQGQNRGDNQWNFNDAEAATRGNTRIQEAVDAKTAETANNLNNGSKDAVDDARDQLDYSDEFKDFHDPRVQEANNAKHIETQGEKAKDYVAARNPVKKWCLAAGTRIQMANGFKFIEDIKVGDITLFGGAVTNISAIDSIDVYSHNGVNVGGGHAVFDNGSWKRIGDGIGTKLNKAFTVYPMDTVNHIILANDTIFSDNVEVPGVESDEECLSILNKDTTLPESIQFQLRKVKYGS